MKLFDAHCDTALAVVAGESLQSRPGPVSLQRAEKMDAWHQVFAFFTEEPDRPDDGQWETLSRRIGAFSAAAAEAGMPTSAHEGLSRSRLAIFGVEGCEQLPHGEHPAKAAFDLGVRVFGLTWNHDNRFAGAALDSGSGLTPEGRALCREIAELGGIVDCSHLSERAFYELADHLPGPWIASHSNARKLCDHPRNLSMDQLTLLGARRGMVGLNFHMPFIGDGPDGVEMLCDHTVYLAMKLGMGNVGLGMDLDGSDRILPECASMDRLEAFGDRLLTRGLSAREVEGIFHDNFATFFKSQCRSLAK